MESLKISDEKRLEDLKKLSAAKTLSANMNAHMAIGIVSSLKGWDFLFNRKKINLLRKQTREAWKNAHEVQKLEMQIFELKKKIEAKLKPPIETTLPKREKKVQK